MSSSHPTTLLIYESCLLTDLLKHPSVAIFKLQNKTDVIYLTIAPPVSLRNVWLGQDSISGIGCRMWAYKQCSWAAVACDVGN